MRFQGEIEVQFEQHVALFRTIVRYVAPQSAQIAFWLQPSCGRDWPLPTKYQVYEAVSTTATGLAERAWPEVMEHPQ
jgi:hypothetical protein